MNQLSAEKRALLEALLRAGLSVRSAAQLAGVDKNTAHAYRWKLGARPHNLTRSSKLSRVALAAAAARTPKERTAIAFKGVATRRSRRGVPLDGRVLWGVVVGADEYAELRRISMKGYSRFGHAVARLMVEVQLGAPSDEIAKQLAKIVRKLTQVFAVDAAPGEVQNRAPHRASGRGGRHGTDDH
jgi:hypothetical protein